jgi:hypothetical protein
MLSHFHFCGNENDDSPLTNSGRLPIIIVSSRIINIQFTFRRPDEIEAIIGCN